MTLEDIRKAVESSSSTTQMAWAFRDALGVKQIAPKPKVSGVRWERLMNQRYGAMDRVRL